MCVCVWRGISGFLNHSDTLSSLVFPRFNNRPEKWITVTVCYWHAALLMPFDIKGPGQKNWRYTPDNNDEHVKDLFLWLATFINLKKLSVNSSCLLTTYRETCWHKCNHIIAIVRTTVVSVRPVVVFYTSFSGLQRSIHHTVMKIVQCHLVKMLHLTAESYWCINM